VNLLESRHGLRQAALEEERRERAETEKALRGTIEELQVAQVSEGQSGFPQLVTLRQQLASALSARVSASHSSHTPLEAVTVNEAYNVLY